MEEKAETDPEKSQSFSEGLEDVSFRAITLRWSEAEPKIGFEDLESEDDVHRWLDEKLESAAGAQSLDEGEKRHPVAHILWWNRTDDRYGESDFDNLTITAAKKMGLESRVGQGPYSVLCRARRPALWRKPSSPKSPSWTEPWGYSGSFGGCYLNRILCCFWASSATTVAVCSTDWTHEIDGASQTLKAVAQASADEFKTPFPILQACVSSYTRKAEQSHKAIDQDIRRALSGANLDADDIVYGSTVDVDVAADNPQGLTDLAKAMIRGISSIKFCAVSAPGYCDLAKYFEDEVVKYEKFMSDIMTGMPTDEFDGTMRAISSLAESFTHMKHGFNKDQKLVAAFQWSWDITLQGLRVLIARLDQEATARLAEQSMNVAQESRRIAEDSWKDTTSMTAITIITMIFLPGTFTSTLFSTPWFEELVGGGDARYQLKVFVALTAALTVMVVCLWYFWSQTRRKRRAKAIIIPIRQPSLQSTQPSTAGRRPEEHSEAASNREALNQNASNWSRLHKGRLRFDFSSRRHRRLQEGVRVECDQA